MIIICNSSKNDIMLGKKIKYLFLRYRSHHLQPPAPKIFIAFPVFALINHLQIVNIIVSLISCHFVCFG